MRFAHALALLRPRHWIKNAVVAAPLLLTPVALNGGSLARVALATLAFCLAASAAYIFNDLCDREADARDAAKSRRPVASGAVEPRSAVNLMTGLAVLAVIAAWLAHPYAAGVVAGYLFLTMLYSMRLKRYPLLDVAVVALGFVLRLEAGGFAAGVKPTGWIESCIFLVALLLALSKRRAELASGSGVEQRVSLGGYTPAFLDVALGAVAAALIGFYFVYATQSGTAPRLYLTAPFVAIGTLRYLQVALSSVDATDPIETVWRDRFLQLCVAGWVATFAWLLYA